MSWKSRVQAARSAPVIIGNSAGKPSGARTNSEKCAKKAPQKCIEWSKKVVKKTQKTCKNSAKIRQTNRTKNVKKR